MLDILVRADNAHDVQVEMQIRVHAELPERMLDNWARTYTRQLKKGEGYEMHRPVLALWIVDEAFGDGIAVFRHYDLRDTDGRRLSEQMDIMLLDLSAWRANLSAGADRDILDEGLAEWLEILGGQVEFELDDEASALPEPWNGRRITQEVVQIMAEISRSDRAWYRAESRRNGIWEREAMKREGLREGRKEGLKEGLKEGFEVGRAEGLAAGLQAAKLEDAARLKGLGVSVEIICQATGLARGVVENL